MYQMKIIFFIADIDVYAKFCFIEYEQEADAQRAVEAEDGAAFKTSTLSMIDIVLIYILSASKLTTEQQIKQLKDFTFMLYFIMRSKLDFILFLLSNKF